MFFIVFCVLVNIKFKCINFSRLYVRAVYMRAKKSKQSYRLFVYIPNLLRAFSCFDNFY